MTDEQARMVELHGHSVEVRGFDATELVEGMARTRVPFNELVGLRFTLVSPDRIEAELEVRPEHHQPSGVVHGGVYTTLVEAVGSTGSVAHVAADGRLAMGVHNATSFLRPTTAGVLTAVATPIHLGRTPHLWDGRITRDDGRLAAKGELRACLASRAALSFRDLMRQGADDHQILWALSHALSIKADGHFFNDPDVTEHERVGMSLIGG